MQWMRTLSPCPTMCLTAGHASLGRCKGEVTRHTSQVARHIPWAPVRISHPPRLSGPGLLRGGSQPGRPCRDRAPKGQFSDELGHSSVWNSGQSGLPFLKVGLSPNWEGIWGVGASAASFLAFARWIAVKAWGAAGHLGISVRRPTPAVAGLSATGALLRPRHVL